ncbi:hypothetical protein Tco_1141354 [Tanacetum coccineum]
MSSRKSEFPTDIDSLIPLDEHLATFRETGGGQEEVNGNGGNRNGGDENGENRNGGNGVHDTFHVSNLKKCLADPTLQVPLDEIRVDAKLNFVEEPVEILEREFKKLKRSRIAIVKVRWNSKRGPEFTWEREDQMKLKYPHLFSDVSS